MNYLKYSASLAGIASIALAFVAIFALVFGVVAVAAAGSFLLLFPVTLMTAPAVKRLVKRLNAKVREEVKTGRAV